ncbi:C-C motif chemokine 25 isoform X2 [Talpa occidentalis]|uniref:C-C motif chemokine 25 isoform X2 n=1 Tax=Talpa occidentalis TaxID=50954 RepID=UPI001890326B|nr:C-C motif chemokine 25 isoform X2 [Talpa occidentalis]
MNLWLLGLVACFVSAWAPAVHTQGVFEDCCLAYQHRVRWGLRKCVQDYQIQHVSGSCNLPAVIFFFGQKKWTVCANPKARWVQDWVKFVDKRKDAHPKPSSGNLSAICARLLSSKPSNPSVYRTRTSVQTRDSARQ